jgi:DNA-directed RNA polymerase subunit M/transcription elongation factor TFIIS
MTSICLEIKTECKHCGGSLIINALVNEVLCPACHKANEFPYGYWKESIISSALNEHKELKEGEGQNSTLISGEYTFNIMYGILKPRCGKCKTSLNPDKFGDYAKSGKTNCEKCGNEISVRTVPENLKGSFPNINFLIGEDSDMFSKGDGNIKTPNAVKPILFTCPACAGNLKVDGSDRVITCNFCNSDIYLPDDLWFRLHPVKVVERWYLIVR